MEMRSLTRSLLRARPTSLYTTPQQPSSLLRAQFLSHQQHSLRFASSDNTPRGPRSTQSSPSTPPSAKPTDSGASDFDQILDKLNINSAAPSPQDPYSSTSPGSPSGSPNQRSGTEDGMSVTRSVGAATSPVLGQTQRKVPLKLGPTLGRQIYVEPERGVDLAMSLRFLASTCAQNKVKRDLQSQKFHIRRGQVIKNKRVFRWRRLFKYSFQHTVSRIKKMRAQGW